MGDFTNIQEIFAGSQNQDTTVSQTVYMQGLTVLVIRVRNY